MSATSFTTRVCLVTLALAGATFLAAPEAKSITYGEPDCADIATNTDCWHPNTVNLTSFGYRGGSRLVSNLRGTGTLLVENADRFVILTAGHNANAFLDRLRDGSDVHIGVSFDAKIDVDLPWIGPIAWSPKQFILGGQSVLSPDYGPHGFNSGVFAYDLAVIVFEIPEEMRFKSDRFGRPRGALVDLSGIPLVTLPEQDYLLDKVSGSEPLQVTVVGYGEGQKLNGPGEGGNPEGPTFHPEKNGERWMTHQTPAFHFMGQGRNLLYTSQNPARDEEGSCNGDSGGPLFYVDQGDEIQVAITSAGDRFCRANGFNTRTDTAKAIAFIDCVTAPDAELEDILACGCTELTDKGVCPAE
jgi:hypothetical protein